jgi:NAD(P)-dependent dehydrogenase (short-subunit alcohol dehydrogenase family)
MRQQAAELAAQGIRINAVALGPLRRHRHRFERSAGALGRLSSSGAAGFPQALAERHRPVIESKTST